jgi:CDP-diacylglycerol--serine O-phosphatidyltransferase
MNDQPNHRLRRGVHLLPASLTVGNLFFGYFAILSSARGTVGDLDAAAKAIGLAVVLDALDGRVARMSKGSSPFGKEFDSLADVISFGLAPAFLALVWGLRGLNPSLSSHPEWVQNIYYAGWVACFFFVICGAWRLARFNIQAGEAPNPGVPPHRYFVGLPIPAAAGVVAALVHAFPNPITQWYWAAGWAALIAGLAFLMISPIRFFSPKHIDLGRRRPSVAVIVIGLLVALIWKFSRPALLVIAVGYVLAGLAGLARRRLLGHTG